MTAGAEVGAGVEATVEAAVAAGAVPGAGETRSACFAYFLSPQPEATRCCGGFIAFSGHFSAFHII